MAISKDDVLKVANLARISLSDEELKLFSGQLESILGFIDKLKTLDISNTEPTSHVLGVSNVLRPDKLSPPVNRDEILKGAPDKLKEFFRVPKIIE